MRFRTEASFLATPLVVPSGAWLHTTTFYDYGPGTDDCGGWDRYSYAGDGQTYP